MKVYEKMIIFSKLVFFDENDELINESLKYADLFYNEGIHLRILAGQRTINKLLPKIPLEYKVKIRFILRNKQMKETIKNYKDNDMIFGLVGVVDEDAHFSFNCKIPLFNPKRLMKQEIIISEKIEDYGLPLLNYESIVDCFKAFEIHRSNYFNIKFNEQFNVISLNNANSMYRPEEEERIKNIFQVNLKAGVNNRNSKILLILLFHLINEVTTNSYYKKVDYWGTFPSSDPYNTDTTVSFLKESVRKIIGGKPNNGPEILIRHSPMQSKRSSKNTRKQFKSDRDYDTLIVNPLVISKIKNKVICIIDDYITNGYSAESAKHLLLAAGAKEIIFLSFGKFGKAYYSTDYQIEGDVSDEYDYTFMNEQIHTYYYGDTPIYDSNNDLEILEFSGIFKI